MIALDSSAVVRFVANSTDPGMERVARAIRDRIAHLPPVVLTEVLSNPAAANELAQVVLAMPLLLIKEGYWERTAAIRADLLRRRLRAGLADCLVAQSCIDNDVPLITYDRDFRHFQVAGLKLA